MCRIAPAFQFVVLLRNGHCCDDFCVLYINASASHELTYRALP
jgi:hypothetical protein